MATFAELQCFNKILLEKMEQMKRQHRHKELIMEKEYYQLEATYNSFKSLIFNADEGLDACLCGGCDLWFHISEGDTCQNEGCFFCDTCKHDYFTPCFHCEEIICRDCEEFKVLDSCKYCYLCEHYPDAEHGNDKDGWEEKSTIARECASKASKRKRVS